MDDESIDYDSYIDYSVKLPNDMFMCLMVDSNRLSEELSNFESYYLDELDLIDSSYHGALNKMLDFIGLNQDIDGILDLMIDNKENENRLFYLKSVLYYTTTQEGKPINTYNLKVKHFDDFMHQFSEDFVFFDVISNNEDYSESEIYLMTYLTEKELKNKFTNYII